jgi:hypothetical protein
VRWDVIELPATNGFLPFRTGSRRVAELGGSEGRGRSNEGALGQEEVTSVVSVNM